MDVLTIANTIVNASYGSGYNPSSFTTANFWADFMRYLIIGFVVSLGFAIWFYIVHRNAARRKEDPKDAVKTGTIPSPSARTYKKVWLVFILLVMLMFYSLIVASLPNDHNVRSPPASVQSEYPHSLNVYVYGQQWQWQYYMPKYHLWYLYQTNLPANTTIYLHVTSRDVMHDFAVPAFKVKVDAFPSHWNTVWTEVSTPGVYMAECMEYCGIAHYLMRSPLTVMTYNNFNTWATAHAGQKLIGAYGPYVQEAGMHSQITATHNPGLANLTTSLNTSGHANIHHKSDNTFAVLSKNLNRYVHTAMNRMRTDAHRMLQVRAA